MKKQLLKVMLFLFFIASQAYAQNRVITGTVTGKEDGLPLPGVSVVVKGTTMGTQTSNDGKYSISVPAGKNVLVFSYVSYKKLEKTLGADNTLHVVLETDSKALSEVVVTGTGVATSRLKTSIAVESITAKDLPAAPTATIDQALVGKIAGAQISSIDGTPGAKTNILLRGINTLQSATTPMIMLDGVQLGPGTDISTLDLSNLDRIEVVEGAAGGSLYGAQGANGVIQIFTKRGKIGAPKIIFNTSYGVSSILNIGNVHQANLHGFLTDANNNILNSKTLLPATVNPDGSISSIAWALPSTGYPSPMANPFLISNKPYDQNLKYYDHIAQLFQTAGTVNSNLSISGANDKSDYAITAGYNKQQSNIVGNGDYTKYHLSTNLGITLFKGFTLRSSTQLIYTQDALNQYFTNAGNSIYNALNTAPFFDFNAKLADGTYPYRLNAGGQTSVNGANPFYYEEYGNRIDNKIDVIENINANYKINKFLELDAKYGINYDSEDDHRVYLNQSQNLNAVDFNAYIGPGTITGGIRNLSYKTTFQNALVSAYFRTNFRDDFHINLPITTSTQLSYDYRKNRYSEYDSQGLGLPTYPIYNMNQTSSQQVTLDLVKPFITYGYLVNQTIDYGDYGGISGGIRSDYSSAFGGGSTPFTFPHAAANIRPSSFGFWKNTALGNVIPEFKLRAAYGKAGIQPGAFDRYVTLNAGNVGNQLAFSFPITQSNPNLRPEISQELETGTDIIFNGLRGNWLPNLNLSFTYWTRKGSDVIYGVNQAPSQGSDLILTNAIDLASHGIQAALTINAYKSKKFNWNFTTNFSKETSTITHINGPDIILTSSAGSTSLVLTAGQKIGEIYGFKALTSLNQTNSQGVPYILPVDYNKYEIVNGRVVNTATRGIQFANESTSLGDPNPKFNMSFINDMSFSNFITLSFQIDWVYGSHLYNQTKEWMYRDGISGDYTVPVNIGGTSAAYVAYYRSAYADFFGTQNGARNSTKDYFYEDASFVRLRNVSLGIDLAKFTKKKIFNQMQIVFTGRNLFTITKYTGFDPEISSGTQGSAFDRGVDHNSMPNVKTYQLGLNLGF